MTQGKVSVSHKPPEGQGGHKDPPAAPPDPPSYEEATAGEGMKAGNVPPPPPGWNFGDPGPGSGEFPGDTEPLGPLGWDDGNVRRLFVRKVYALLLLQLLLTTGVVALFTFCDPVKGYIQTHPGWYWASYAIFFLTYLILACCSGLRRRFPWNLILLGIFTLSLAYLTAMLSSYYDTKAVLLCLGITALVCLGISILSFQSKLDFTSCQGILAVLLLVLLLGGILLGLLLPYGYVPWLHGVYALLGALVFSLFLALDTQLLLGTRRYSLNPEEFVFGALNIYLDIIHVFSFLLQFLGSNRE